MCFFYGMPESLSFPYCTLEDVRNETRNIDPSIEETLKVAINLASRSIDNITKRDFLFHDYSSEAYAVPDEFIYEKEFFLPWQIITLTEINVSGVTSHVFRQDYNFRIGSRRVRMRGKIITDEIEDYLEVKGTFGHEYSSEDSPAESLPQSVRRAATLIAAAWSSYNLKEQVALDGSKVELLDSRIPKEAMDLLKPFMREVT